MSKKFLFIIFFSFFLSNNVHASRFYILGGFSISSLPGAPESTSLVKTFRFFYDYRFGNTVGLAFDFFEMKKGDLSLELGLFYNDRQVREGDYLYKLPAVQIPFLLKYHFGKKKHESKFFGFGVYVSKALGKATQLEGDFLPLTELGAFDYTSSEIGIDKTDYGLSFALSGSILSLVVQWRYSYALNNVSLETGENYGLSTHQFLMGYNF